MYNFEDVGFDDIIIHKVGNKGREENLTLAEHPVTIDDEPVRELLKKYFLSPFKGEVFFSFKGNKDENKLWQIADRVFSDPGSFLSASKEVAEHLYSKSLHPQIKEGEIYLVYFQDCVIDSEFADAIGIFKSENKDTYLKVCQKKNEFNIEYEDGININKLDKGCLILNTEKENGYKICVVDTVARNSEIASYWKDDFLLLKERKDNYYNTHHYMNMCKEFASNVMTPENEYDKSEKISMLNKTVGYFKEKDHFSEDDFTREVIAEPKVIDAFNSYKEKYMEETAFPGMGDFEISKGAVQSKQREFKSILKLDKNFHVYIHGDTNMIEKGFDDARGLPYYKLYYSREF